MNESPVVIIGGGLIGLSVGWQLLRKGRRVEIFERAHAGRGAAWGAAGVLEPSADGLLEEPDMLRLSRESFGLYPQFLDELREDSGTAVGFSVCGTLRVAPDRDEVERLRRLCALRKELGLPAEWLSGTQAREVEPFLSPRVAAGAWIAGDAEVDNRALMEALRSAFLHRGGVLHEGVSVSRCEVEAGRVRRVVSPVMDCEGSAVVVAAGCGSAEIGGIPEAQRPPLRPVEEQALALQTTDECRLRHIVQSARTYLVPQGDGRLIVGASVGYDGGDLVPTAGVILDLLQDAWRVVPGTYELPIEEALVGFRPATGDHGPIIGPTEIEGLYYATGHDAQGILLAPITAYALADLIAKGRAWAEVRPFEPGRFGTTGSVSIRAVA